MEGSEVSYKTYPNIKAQPHPNPLLRGDGIEGIKKLSYKTPSPLRRGVGGEVLASTKTATLRIT
jgi:hypothetical protein